jgi:hypothetical protein
VLLGNGDGTFGAASSTAAGNGCRSVAVADVNGDDLPDVVTANFDGDDVSVLLGNGDGSLQPPTSLPTGTRPISVAVIDLNGDLAADIVSLDNGSGDANVLLGNGDGTFQAAVSYAIGWIPQGMTLADATGDGTPDLIAVFPVVSGSDAVGVLAGNGDGSFQPVVQVAVAPDASSVVVADMNGDSIPDLVTPDDFRNEVNVMLGTGGGGFLPRQSFTIGTYAHPRSLSVGDLNGDGVLDVLTANYSRSDVSVLLGRGDGSLFSARVSEFYGPRGSTPVMDVADVDDDGLLDLAVVGQELVGDYLEPWMRIGLSNGDGTFSDKPGSVLDPNLVPTAVAAGDLDGDDLADLAVSDGVGNGVDVLIGAGTGFFSSITPTPLPVAAGPTTVARALLDGDAVPDLVTAGGNSVSALLGNGGGTFQAAVTTASLWLDGISALVADDFDADGDLDVATANVANQTASVWFGNGNGTFQAPSLTSLLPIGTNPRDIASADLNGDSIPDLVTANQDSADVSVLLGTGGGSFGPGVAYPAPYRPVSVTIADVNDDGVPDLLVAQSFEVGVLLGNGDGTFQPQRTFAVGEAYPFDARAVQLDGDGVIDVVAVSPSGDFMLAATGLTNQTHLLPEPGSAASLAAGITWLGLLVRLRRKGSRWRRVASA